MGQRITRQSAKAKGRWLQQWVCQRISDLTGYQWGNSGQDQPIESRPMGQKGPDIRMESQVLALFPFSIECKFTEKWDIHSWIKQVQEEKFEGTDWMIVAKRSRRNPVVIMDAERFFQLLQSRRRTR